MLVNCGRLSKTVKNGHHFYLRMYRKGYRCYNSFIPNIGSADESPQIENLQEALELNSGSEFHPSCIATGKPLPTQEEFKLIKQDGIVLKVS